MNLKFKRHLIFGVLMTSCTFFTATSCAADTSSNEISYDTIRASKQIILNQSTNYDDQILFDFNNDGYLNVFDLCLQKKAILSEAISSDIPDYGTAPNTSAELYADFRNGSVSEFFASDGWSNGSVFDCIWRESNAVFENKALNLIIDSDASSEYDYSGAEYRTYDFYHYGYYEVSMQPIKNDGVVSSFFTYTGPSDGNPWDEIDIEFLGKDTTKIQFNYYTNGIGNHEFIYELGFDASEGYHTYGFDWQPDSITWYVDGSAVYSAYDNIPITPSKIMLNVWPGINVDGWLNPYDGNTPLTARYQWISYDTNGKSD